MLTPIVLDPWRTGLTFQAVRGRLRKLRQRLGPRVLRPSVWRYERILALAQEGLRPAQVAARVGMSYVAVWKRLDGLRRRGASAPGSAQAAGAGA